MGVKSSSLDNLTSNYFTEHPPELFFVQNTKSAHPDSLLTYLLNFVPTNKSTDFGQSGVWTGKLYDWDLKSKNLHVQEILKNKLVQRYVLSCDKINKSSVKGITTNSFWDWLGEVFGAIVDLLNTIGFYLGIPGTSGVRTEYTMIPSPWGFDAGGGNGGGGVSVSNGGSDNEYSPEYPPEIIYLPYFQGHSGDQQPTWGPYVDPNAGAVSANNIISLLYITDVSKQDFLLNNQSISDLLYNYLQQQGFTSDNENLVNWAIGYLMANPTVSIDVFKNQFLSQPEGLDGPDAYDDNYWSDPNLQISQQPLPSYQNFYDNFPNIDAASVYNLVGGQPLANRNADPRYYQDACALRVSRALNYSGVNIPALKGTQVGADGKNYFLSARTLNVWLNKTFGTPTYHFTKAQLGTNGENFPTLANGVKGIYSMIAVNWIATGHADLYFGTNCARGCDITSKTDYIDIWVLQ